MFSLNPGAVPFSPMDTPCSNSLLFEPTADRLILTTPELTRAENVDDTVMSALKNHRHVILTQTLITRKIAIFLRSRTVHQKKTGLNFV